MMDKQPIINWLLEGDVAIQYQVHRDLLASEKSDLRDRIASEGWGQSFLIFARKRGIGGAVLINPNGFQATIQSWI